MNRSSAPKEKPEPEAVQALQLEAAQDTVPCFPTMS